MKINVICLISNLNILEEGWKTTRVSALLPLSKEYIIMSKPTTVILEVHPKSNGKWAITHHDVNPTTGQWENARQLGEDRASEKEALDTADWMAKALNENNQLHDVREVVRNDKGQWDYKKKK